MSSHKEPQRKAWVVTDNGEKDELPTVEKYKKFFEEMGSNLNWGVFQAEKGKKSGRYHIHAVWSGAPMRFSQIRKKLGKVKLQYFDKDSKVKKYKEPKYGVEYCSKEETRVEGPFWYNEDKAPKAERADRDRSDKAEELKIFWAKMLDPSINNGEIVREFPQRWSTHGKNRASMLGDINPVSREWETRCIWVWGPGGVGKTKFVTKYLKLQGVSTYEWTGGKWWQGYNGQTDVVVSDITHMDLPIPAFKRLVDSSNIQMEVKGGSTPLGVKRIWILVNYPFGEFWGGIADRDWNAITRRIQEYKIEESLWNPEKMSYHWDKTPWDCAEHPDDLWPVKKVIDMEDMEGAPVPKRKRDMVTQAAAPTMIIEGPPTKRAALGVGSARDDGPITTFDDNILYGDDGWMNIVIQE